jgi:hypothetical protein
MYVMLWRAANLCFARFCHFQSREDISGNDPCRSYSIAHRPAGDSTDSGCHNESVDLLPLLFLRKRSGKLVLKRSEVGKSCLRF